MIKRDLSNFLISSHQIFMKSQKKKLESKKLFHRKNFRNVLTKIVNFREKRKKCCLPKLAVFSKRKSNLKYFEEFSTNINSVISRYSFKTIQDYSEQLKSRISVGLLLISLLRK